MTKYFIIREKNTFIKRAEEEWKHDKVYCPKGHDDIYVCIDLHHDFKGHGGLYASLTLFMIQKSHRVIRRRRDLLYESKGHVDFFC